MLTKDNKIVYLDFKKKEFSFPTEPPFYIEKGRTENYKEKKEINRKALLGESLTDGEVAIYIAI